MSSQGTSNQATAAPAIARSRPDELARLGQVLAYILLCALTLSPLLCAAVPPLVDYPNHLARMWVLVHRREITDLAQNYAVHWQLIPNLAMDMVVPTLAQVMPIETAGRVFIALIMLALVTGTAVLHRSLHGSLGLWPLSSLLFVYNAALSWGFLNSLFGIGVYLFAFSAWVSVRNRPIATRVAVFSLVAAFLFLCHLFAFGLYGLTVTAYEIEMRLVRRRPTFAELRALFLLSLHFVPALLLWAASTGGPTHIEYGSLSDKVHAVLAPTTFLAQSPVVLDGIMGGLTLTFLYGALRSGSLKLAPGMRLPMIALGLTALLMPNVLDGSWLADIRLPVALPFIVIGATRLEVDARWRTALACVALVLLAARLWGVTNLWRDYDARTAELRAATAVIDRGARLLVVEDPIPSADQAVAFVPSVLGERRNANFWHLPALTVIDRSAFIPYLFSGWTTIEPTARNAGLFQTTGYPLPSALLMTSTTVAQMDASALAPNMLGEMPYWGGWPEKFDFVLWIKFGPDPPPQLPQLQAVASGSFFYIYRVTGR